MTVDQRPRHLSPSRAGDFKTCPQLYKFRAVDRIETPPNVHQARGVAIHLALELLYGLPASDRTPEAAFELFRQAWSELRTDDYAGLFDDLDAEREWGVESMRLLANYFAVEDPTQVQPLESELSMKEQVGPVTIRGVLDRIDRIDGRLVITDYKTGKPPPERFAFGAFFALKIYALLVRQIMGETPTEVRLLYLNGPTLYTMPVNDRQLDAMDEQLRALWRRIMRSCDDDNFPPRPGPLCDWCDFKPMCPAWAGAPPASGDEFDAGEAPVAER